MTVLDDPVQRWWWLSTPASTPLPTHVTQRGTTTTAAVVGGTSATVNAPTGLANTDLLVAVMWTATSRTYTPPSGWTLYQSGSVSLTQYLIYYKYAGSSEGSSYTFSISGANDDINIHLSAFVGSTVAASTPLTLFAETSYTSSTATFVAPSNTVVTGGSAVIRFYVNQDEGTSVSSAPSGLTQMAFSQLSDGETMASYFSIQAAPGATGTSSLTWASGGRGVAGTFTVNYV